MRTLIAVTLALSAFAAQAADTYAFGKRVLVIEDGAGRVVELAGQPDRKETLENKRGAAIGERWEYYRDGKTILITIKDGKVKKIQEKL